MSKESSTISYHGSRRIRFIGLGAMALAVVAVVAFVAATQATSPAAERTVSDDSSHPAYGVNFISSAEDHAPGSGRTADSLEQQYQNGLATGATWNRWPLYWFNIEQSPDNFNWATQDATIQADMAHGLQLNAILLGTPPFYTTGLTAGLSTIQPLPRQGGLSLNAPEQATPVGLYEPVFDDGTDVPGAGKTINPDNHWARFVALAVDRYRPGGVLAQANIWGAGVGVTHWEMWNEPDLDSFGDASVEDYALACQGRLFGSQKIRTRRQLLSSAQWRTTSPSSTTIMMYWPVSMRIPGQANGFTTISWRRTATSTPGNRSTTFIAHAHILCLALTSRSG
ncbi:MAG: hypothetical protein R3C44_16130 [Chloroflexota bacterium]